MSDEQGEQFHQGIKTMEEHYQGWWGKWMMADYCWSIKSDLNNIEHDNQERENFYHSSYVHERFTSVVSLLNDLTKIIVGLDIFNRVIFKSLGIWLLLQKKYFSISRPIFVGLNMNWEVFTI